MLVVLSCSDAPSGPPSGPGDLVASLASPNGAEGAAVFEVTGGGIIVITVEAGQAVHFQSGGISRIVVLLDEPGDIGFTMTVEDRRAVSNLRVIEVADSANVLRDDLSGYVATLNW